ncbi:MAG: ribbon-helix-helix domain-containing protein [Nanoarchaeota archaeon]|nr:ribbon-helix-helix domain-containing protein [Nanoarchaeota archaeon]
MEAISIRFQENILKKMDKTIRKNNFNSRTEFIREAVREKLTDVERAYAINEFFKLYGKGKPKTNLSDRQIREIVSKELMEDLDRRFRHSED